ncbi:cytochrome b [Vibrio rumoiensis]|uniref:Cytochrome b n=1 Tax=Vibrio rumoiensis 1S-45 TaxID=1188252 RepID=A0A1E5E4A4_9VIBR|nr:cytochrome b [Vibrio rumoiensis]OEF27599.1 cytochrome b [Vibrio rumoiensis 1S-45]
MKLEVKQYNFLAKLNHWLSAIIIIGLFAAGWWMVDLNYYSAWYQDAPHWHKSVGLLLAAYTVFRVVWKLITATPKIEGSHFEKVAAKIAHTLMYALLFGIFISGYLISTSDGRGIDIFDWVTVPSLGALFEDQTEIAGTLHYYFAYVLIGLALVHAAAALKHHFINKDNTLRKITGAIK